jgi:hypothetical protein
MPKANSRKSSVGLFSRLRSEIGALLGFGDVDNINFAQRMRLDRAVALRIEIERLQSEQMAGEPVDIRRLTEAYESARV